MQISKWMGLVASTAALMASPGGAAEAAGKPAVTVADVRSFVSELHPGKEICSKVDALLHNSGNAVALPQEGRRKGYRLELFLSFWKGMKPGPAPAASKDWFYGIVKLGSYAPKWPIKVGEQRRVAWTMGSPCAALPKDLRPGSSHYLCAVANRGDKHPDGRDASSMRCRSVLTRTLPEKVVFEKDFGEIGQTCETDPSGERKCTASEELVTGAFGKVHVEFELTKGPSPTLFELVYLRKEGGPWTASAKKAPEDANGHKGVPKPTLLGEKQSFAAWLLRAGERLAFRVRCKAPCTWAGKLRVVQRSDLYK